jgi:hypothetical protein
MAKNVNVETVAEIVEADRRATLTLTMEDGTLKFKCQYCGKLISADSFEEFMAGSYCHQLRDEQGWTEADLREHRLGMSANDVPVAEDGREYVKVAVLGRICRREGIPVSRLVKAFGKDRCIDGALHEKFQPVYVGRARYVHPDCGETWGLNYLRTMQGGRDSNGGSEQAAVESALS